MRLLPALALAAALATAACTNPHGSPNVPGTLALGAGAVIAGLAIASANDRPRYSDNRHYRGSGHGYRSGYRHGHSHGHRGYRRW
jgi:hypothetical protein